MIDNHMHLKEINTYYLAEEPNMNIRVISFPEQYKLHVCYKD